MKSYVIGFVLSLVLTAEAYIFTTSHRLSSTNIIAIVLILAIVQLLVQLFFFLHLDRAFKAPWNILVFVFMGLVVSTLIFGSLWIMRNLDYNHRSPAETEQYLRKNEDL